MNGAILIVARNNVHLTKAAVRTALAQNVPCDVLVIDNASTDGTAAWLRSKEHEKLHVATYPVQRSLAQCWNFGITYMHRNHYGPVLVLNNDVEIRPDMYVVLYTCLVGALDTLNTGIVTGTSVDNREQLGSVGDRESMDIWLRRRPHPDFSNFMIHQGCTDIVGWFDEDYYPAYCEDGDYHLRMHRAGVQAYCVDMPVYHVRSRTVKLAEPGEQARIRRAADANRERFKKKYGCMPYSPEYAELFK